MDGAVGKEHVTAPDLIEPVLGYKVLEITQTGVISSPYQRSIEWKSPRMTAKCLKHAPNYMGMPHPKEDTHDSPHTDCQCGLYSYYEIQYVAKAPIYKGMGVIAVTTSTGTIEAHSKGMRAQHQELRAVALSSQHSPSQLEEIRKGFRTKLKLRADKWNIPFLVDWQDLPLFALEAGLSTMPESLRPL